MFFLLVFWGGGLSHRGSRLVIAKKNGCHNMTALQVLFLWKSKIITVCHSTGLT